jgi:hypothetical protein
MSTHKIVCSVCGCEFDPLDLNQVIYHEQVPHRPIEAVQYVGLRIDTLPEWIQKCRSNPSTTDVRKMIWFASEMADVLSEVKDMVRQMNDCSSSDICTENQGCPDRLQCMCCLQISRVLHKWDEGIWG